MFGLKMIAVSRQYLILLELSVLPVSSGVALIG
jgi:hypothetical protein